LGALISHVFTHRVYPARCLILRRFVISKPAQTLCCAVSHRSGAAPTFVLSAADKPTFHPSPGPRAHASTHSPFHKVCALDVSHASSLCALPAEFQTSGSTALQEPNKIILLAGGWR